MRKKMKKVLTVVLVFSMMAGITTGLLPSNLKEGMIVFAGSKSYQDEIDAAKKKKEELQKAQKELEKKLSELKAKIANRSGNCIYKKI